MPLFVWIILTLFGDFNFLTYSNVIRNLIVYENTDIFHAILKYMLAEKLTTLSLDEYYIFPYHTNPMNISNEQRLHIYEIKYADFIKA